MLCVPGRGPLDAAVSAMATQLLRRAGCNVEEQVRDRLPNGNVDTLPSATAETFCILGLFDRRAAARLEPLILRLKDQYQGAAVILGVERGSDDTTEGEEAFKAVATFTELCAAVAKKRDIVGGRT